MWPPPAEDWALIGPGGIGRELLRQIAQPHIAGRMELSPLPRYVMGRSGIYEPDGKTPTGLVSIDEVDNWPRVTFLANPPTDDGQPGFGYLMNILERSADHVAITCAKGELSNYYEELRDASDDFERLGYNGAVGGGMRMKDSLEVYCRDLENITQLHVVPNGSLNAILSSKAAGYSLGQAIALAKISKFVEPGNEDPYDIIRGEACGDIPKKMVILLKSLGFWKNRDDPLHWKDFSFELSNADISRVIEEVRHRRFIVSVYPKSYFDIHEKYEEDDIIGKFEHEFGNWRVVGGFRDTNRNTDFLQLATMPGPSNSFVIGLGPHESDGLIQGPVGPGAGVPPTVNTMLDDLVRRLPKLRASRELPAKPERFTRIEYQSIGTENLHPQLTREAQLAAEMYRDGLECVVGDGQINANLNPTIDFLNRTDIKQRVDYFRSKGIPMYLGPSAMMGHDGMTVVNSSHSTTSLGIWSPRLGAQIDLDALTHYARIS